MRLDDAWPGDPHERLILPATDLANPNDVHACSFVPESWNTSEYPMAGNA
jgi:hypothetical protein